MSTKRSITTATASAQALIQAPALVPDIVPDVLTTVDVVIFTLFENRLSVVLSRRAHEPYAGQFALPGGYVHDDEDDDLEATACRVLAQKVGIRPPYLEQLYTFSGRLRDPRKWSVSVAYYALVPLAALEGMGEQCAFFPVDDLPALPFDHRKIIDTGVARLRDKAAYSSLPAFLLPETFTFPELQDVYEKVSGMPIDKAFFRRKIDEQDMIEPIAGEMRKTGGRRAQVYRLTARALTQFERVIFVPPSARSA